jgi:16S rRNA (guanine966-N2)-methyltransferase
MRIIAGRFKGRRLETPTWDGLRPTSDKLRETLFNILAARMDGARVLDLFSGTGAVGLEALSRGAAHVLAIDADRRALALAQRNATTCGATADYTIRSGDVLVELVRLAPPAVFDLIFLDPPYAYTRVGEVLVAAAPHLRFDGLVVLERATRVAPDIPETFERVRDVRSGESSLTLLVRRAEAP